MRAARKKIRSLIFIALASLPLASFASSTPPLTADVGYVSLGNLPSGSNLVNPIRREALRETAFTLGAQGALAWRSLQIDHTLKSESSYLDHVFNFNQLLINSTVLPPVLTEAVNSFNLSSSNSIRTASTIYKIVSPARFVTTAPTWRTYLWMDYKKPTLPDHSLLPNTQAEASVWNHYLKQGWKSGLSQANEIFAVNLNRLKRDYVGMVLYRKLLAEHMVSAPFIANTNLGVTGNSQEIRINDAFSRITQNSKLQPNSSKWTPVLTDVNKK